VYDKICKKWYGLVNLLHKEDQQILLKMILEICNYNEHLNVIINSDDSTSSIDYSFFFATILIQQKLTNMIDKNSNMKIKTDV
jgi:hypothetical protein